MFSGIDQHNIMYIIVLVGTLESLELSRLSSLLVTLEFLFCAFIGGLTLTSTEGPHPHRFPRMCVAGSGHPKLPRCSKSSEKMTSRRRDLRIVGTVPKPIKCCHDPASIIRQLHTVVLW